LSLEKMPSLFSFLLKKLSVAPCLKIIIEGRTCFLNPQSVVLCFSLLDYHSQLNQCHKITWLTFRYDKECCGIFHITPQLICNCGPIFLAMMVTAILSNPTCFSLGTNIVIQGTRDAHKYSICGVSVSGLRIAIAFYVRSTPLSWFTRNQKVVYW